METKTTLKNLKYFRMMRNLSQAQLAAKLGKATGTVANWEKGVNYPPLDIITKLCHVLNTTPNQLLDWDPSPELNDFLKEREAGIREMEDLYNQRAEIDSKIKKCILNVKRGRYDRTRS